MWKRVVLLSLYVLILIVTVSSAWILNPEKNIGPFAVLDYMDTPDDPYSGKLTISSKEVEMQVDFEINGKWVSFGSSNDKSFANRPSLTNIVPNTVLPFRIRFYNTSDHVVSMNLIFSGIECHQVLVDKTAVYVAAVGSTEYNRYSDIVNIPGYVYTPVTDEHLISVKEDANKQSVATYDFLLYDDLQIPPTANGAYVTIEGYFYFDAECMDNACAGKTFNIQSIRAVQK